MALLRNFSVLDGGVVIEIERADLFYGLKDIVDCLVQDECFGDAFLVEQLLDWRDNFTKDEFRTIFMVLESYSPSYLIDHLVHEMRPYFVEME